MIKHLAAVSLFAFVLSSGGWVVAEDAPTDKVVLLDLPSIEDLDDATIGALESHLSELDTTLEVRPIADEGMDLIRLADAASKEPGVAAVIWLDTSSEGRLYLYFAAGGEGRVLVRTLEESTSGGRAESLAIIIRSSVQALINGMVIGIGVEEVASPSKPREETAPKEEKVESEPVPAREPAQPSPPPEEPREEAAPRKARLSILAAYVLQTRSAAHPVQHGLAARLEVTAVGGLSFYGGFLFQQAVEGRGELATVEVRRAPLELGASLRLPLAAVFVSARAAFVMDFVQVELKELRVQMEPGWTGTDFIPGALAEIAVEIPLNDRLFLILGAGAEFPFIKRGYTAEDDGVGETLVDAWPVLPRFFAGVRGVVF